MRAAALRLGAMRVCDAMRLGARCEAVRCCSLRCAKSARCALIAKVWERVLPPPVRSFLPDITAVLLHGGIPLRTQCIEVSLHTVCGCSYICARHVSMYLLVTWMQSLMVFSLGSRVYNPMQVSDKLVVITWYCVVRSVRVCLHVGAVAMYRFMCASTRRTGCYPI